MAHSGAVALQHFGAEGDQASKEDGAESLRRLRTLVIRVHGTSGLKSFSTSRPVPKVREHIRGAGG